MTEVYFISAFNREPVLLFSGVKSSEFYTRMLESHLKDGTVGAICPSQFTTKDGKEYQLRHSIVRPVADSAVFKNNCN